MIIKAMLLKQVGTRLLDEVDFPGDYRHFDLDQLKILSDELREEVISTVTQTGGHLGAGLGVVELTVALHYVFNTPQDKLIWDVGHQAYPHKILTGRKKDMLTLRQENGLSGFPKRCESKYDTFGVGHSSTSISAALGMAVANDIIKADEHVIAVIGDGAISAGMAYEAMNNAGHLKKRLIVILNDNQMSIAPAVGAMKNYLCRLLSSKSYVTIREATKILLKKLPHSVEHIVKKAKQYTKDFTTGGNFFEEIGFHYLGPIDGHNIKHLVPILQNVRDSDGIESPILLHIKTEKGKGFVSSQSSSEKYHAIKKQTVHDNKAMVKALSYTKVFANKLIDMAENDTKIIAITAAMPSGTGIEQFAKIYPDRAFDVGIAEQHAVTFAAGIATKGFKPYIAIYSTFLQRAYDQVVHDVAIQSLPVRFIIDRAGYVGADGATHAGSFDIAYLANLPNFVVMAPSDEVELARMVITSADINHQPCAIRFPRGNGIGLGIPANLEPIELGKGRIVKHGSNIAIISLGTRLKEVQKAALMLEAEDINITIMDARFAKPLDDKLIMKIANEHNIIITIEEGAIGGFSAHVQQLLFSNGIFDYGKIFRSMIMPDIFMNHAEHDAMYKKAELDYNSIYNMVKKLCA